MALLIANGRALDRPNRPVWRNCLLPRIALFLTYQEVLLSPIRGSGTDWWVSDNLSGVCTLYNGADTKNSLVVTS
jgi:hypothetical protein